MTTKKRTCLAVAGGLILSAVTVTFAFFAQSFETDTSGWEDAVRVSSGTHLVPSESGAFHAEDGGGAFTRWGGYSKTFPAGGYTTTVDIYLDISPPYGSILTVTPYPNDTRFDWTSAVNTPQCGHRRDFVFNAGFYTDTDSLTGAGPRFVISASNNAGRANSFPKNPGRDPFTIYVEGWYTFEHRFRDNGGGVLAVDLTIRDHLTGAPLHMWTLTTATDIIGETVGGNRYGWFPTDEFPFLAFDTSALIGFQDYCVVPPSTPGAKVTAGGWITVAGGKGTFGLTAKANASGNPSGHLTYQDHPQNITVKSTAITAVILNSSGNCARILGTATVNGTPGAGFDVNVCDNGEPGKDSDTFSIFTSTPYIASGTLGGGNVQIHK
jgi:hypothetical protein